MSDTDTNEDVEESEEAEAEPTNDEPEGAEETSVVADAAEDKSAPSGDDDEVTVLLGALEAAGVEVVYNRDGSVRRVELPKAEPKPKVTERKSSTSKRSQSDPEAKMNPADQLAQIRNKFDQAVIALD